MARVKKHSEINLYVCFWVFGVIGFFGDGMRIKWVISADRIHSNFVEWKYTLYCALFLFIYFSHFKNKYRIKLRQPLNIHEFRNNRNVNLYNLNAAVENCNNNRIQHLRLGGKSPAKLISSLKTQNVARPDQTGPDKADSYSRNMLFYRLYLIWWTVKLCNSVTWFSQ